MIFLAEPKLYVKLSNKIVNRVTGLKGFYFDDKGEYKTENELIIRVLKQNFGVKEELSKYESEQAETVSFKCKKCDYETDNKGELLAHYKQHKKEVE